MFGVSHFGQKDFITLGGALGKGGDLDFETILGHGCENRDASCYFAALLRVDIARINRASGASAQHLNSKPAQFVEFSHVKDAVFVERQVDD